MGIIMALEQGIPDKFGDCFPCQLCPVKCCAKYCLSGFWRADIPAHAHGLVYHIGHPGFKTHTGQDALGCSVPHLNGCNNKIGLVFVFGNIHTRSMRD